MIRELEVLEGEATRSVRFIKSCRLIGDEESEYFEKGSEVELPERICSELIRQGAALPAGIQYGKPVRMVS